MTDWYWQNQQMVYLDKWKRNGLVNICEVENIVNIKPTMFAFSGDDATPGPRIRTGGTSLGQNEGLP